MEKMLLPIQILAITDIKMTIRADLAHQNRYKIGENCPQFTADFAVC